MEPIFAKIIPLERGAHPDHGLPSAPGTPDNSLPPIPGAPDNTLPPSPPGIWPPMSPVHPVQPLPPGSNVPPGTIWPSPGTPDNSLPKPPGTPDQGLPKPPPGVDNTLPSGKFWVVAGIPGIGWRYICVDPSLKPGNALPTPPAAQPK
ncbi:MAG TPA: hypothetical protein VNM37_23415 [Candidatus Dormibacteraeota bacterium]|nr:hypothetical protein [Candidatus Dormibacteraeota bacterium]